MTTEEFYTHARKVLREFGKESPDAVFAGMRAKFGDRLTEVELQEMESLIRGKFRQALAKMGADLDRRQLQQAWHGE